MYESEFHQTMQYVVDAFDIIICVIISYFIIKYIFPLIKRMYSGWDASISNKLRKSKIVKMIAESDNDDDCIRPSLPAYQNPNNYSPSLRGIIEEENEMISYVRMQSRHSEEQASPTMTNEAIAILLFDQLKKKYDIKFPDKLTTTDKSVILSTFIAVGRDVDLNEVIDYTNNHPWVSAYLIDKFAELYYKKKQNNESINPFEVKMFIETAKIFK